MNDPNKSTWIRLPDLYKRRTLGFILEMCVDFTLQQQAITEKDRDFVKQCFTKLSKVPDAKKVFLEEIG
jgi:hypothetical protein